MLREFKGVKQEPGPGRRRWWGGDGLEFTVWYDADDNFSGFQLCYAGRALTWRMNGYWSHVRVGSGIGEIDKRGYSSPILQANGAPTCPPFQLLSTFEQAASESVGEPILEMVTNTLRRLVR